MQLSNPYFSGSAEVKPHRPSSKRVSNGMGWMTAPSHLKPGQTRGDTAIEIGPDTGLVGYPSYIQRDHVHALIRPSPAFRDQHQGHLGVVRRTRISGQFKSVQVLATRLDRERFIARHRGEHARRQMVFDRVGRAVRLRSGRAIVHGCVLDPRRRVLEPVSRIRRGGYGGPTAAHACRPFLHVCATGTHAGKPVQEATRYGPVLTSYIGTCYLVSGGPSPGLLRARLTTVLRAGFFQCAFRLVYEQTTFLTVLPSRFSAYCHMSPVLRQYSLACNRSLSI